MSKRAVFDAFNPLKLNSRKKLKLFPYYRHEFDFGKSQICIFSRYFPQIAIIPFPY